MPKKPKIPLPPSLLSPYFPEGYYQQQKQQSPQQHYDLVKGMSDNPHHLIIGMTGTGKGVLGSAAIEDFYESGGKIVSIHCMKDMEHLFKRYPADGDYRKLISRRGYEPKGYPVEAYLPVCEGFMPEKLPSFFHPYTVPVVDPAITAELLSVVNMVGLTDIVKDAINDLLRELPKKATVVDLYVGVEELLRKGYVKRGLRFELMKKETKPSIHRIIYVLVKHLIMSGANHKLAMTSERFLKMLNRQKEISVFVQAFVPDELQPFFSLFPLELVYTNAQRCKHPILVVGTEIQDIMWNEEVTKSRNPAMKLFNQRVTNLMKWGGKYGIHTLFDTQNVSDISPKFVSQAKLLIFHYEVESEKVYKALGWRKGWMKLEDLNNILLSLRHESKSGLFEFFSPDHGKKIFQVRLPLTAHPYEGNRSDFLRYVQQVEPDREWRKVVPIYTELDRIIVNAAKEKADILKQKRDEAAMER